MLDRTASLKRVGIVVNSYFGPFVRELARCLKQQGTSEIHIYCKGDQEIASYRSDLDSGLYSSATNFMLFYPALGDAVPDSQIVLDKARRYEERMGVTYNTFALGDRHVGRAYALGGFHHPRSRYGEHSSYLQMLHAFNVQFEFWEREIDAKGLGCLIADGKDAAAVARLKGIPYRSIARARYRNFHYWEKDEFREAEVIRNAFHSIAPLEMSEEVEQDLPHYTAGKEIIARAMKQVSLGVVGRQASYIVARHIYAKLRGYAKARGYFLGDQLRLVMRRRRDIRRMLGRETVSLDDLRHTPFIFYPLHTEPEQALGQISPEFYFQLAAISALSRDLPAGVKLAVKEVPMAAGRRPLDFYDQILAHKNVVMLNMAISGLDTVKASRGVATIAGTAGLECALMGKPVISFGRHNPYNVMPHVMVVGDLGELPEFVGRMLGAFDHKRARSDAARYIKAIEQASFDMGEFDYHDLARFSPQAPADACATLLASLAEPESAVFALGKNECNSVGG